MEIEKVNSAMLCDYEVLKHLQKIKVGRNKHKGQLATITYETLRYLENTQCNQQSPESIANCLLALKPFKLRKKEKMMIVNSPPTTPLEIQLIVLNSEERLSEEQVQNIIEIVAEHFPHIQKPLETTEEATD